MAEGLFPEMRRPGCPTAFPSVILGTWGGIPPPAWRRRQPGTGPGRPRIARMALPLKPVPAVAPFSPVFPGTEPSYRFVCVLHMSQLQ